MNVCMTAKPEAAAAANINTKSKTTHLSLHHLLQVAAHAHRRYFGQKRFRFSDLFSRRPPRFRAEQILGGFALAFGDFLEVQISERISAQKDHEVAVVLGENHLVVRQNQALDPVLTSSAAATNH